MLVKGQEVYLAYASEFVFDVTLLTIQRLAGRGRVDWQVAVDVGVKILGILEVGCVLRRTCLYLERESLLVSSRAARCLL